jgi:excisionase family DNA binding protein
MMRDRMDFGYCDYHGESVNEDKYRWKGCWGCHYFRRGKDFPYVFVTEVSKKLGVSESTVRRWIRKNKLEGYLFVQGRHTFTLPSPPTYHIEKESVERLKEKLKTRKEVKRE